jgi:type II secretory pathway component PulF
MPLCERSSQNCFTRNLKAELKAGKPLKQSLAIAYATQRKAKSKGK